MTILVYSVLLLTVSVWFFIASCLEVADSIPRQQMPQGFPRCADFFLVLLIVGVVPAVLAVRSIGIKQFELLAWPPLALLALHTYSFWMAFRGRAWRAFLQNKFGAGK